MAATAGVALGLAPNVPSFAQDIPDGRSASLVGRVLDADTNKPIDDAVVSLQDPPNITPEADPPNIRTNNGGHFLFKGLAEGDYTAQGSADGYVQAREPYRVRIDRNGVSHLEIILQNAPDITPG